MRWAVALVLLGAGCVSKQISGDGRLVLVDIDPAFYGNYVFDASSGSWVLESDAVRSGMHYWDTVGARLRPADEPAEPDERTAEHYAVHRSGLLLGNFCGTCWPGLGYVDIYARDLERFQSGDLFAEMVAHELGHALGLQHVADHGDGLSVMSATVLSARKDLSERDRDEFRAVWPPPKEDASSR